MPSWLTAQGAFALLRIKVIPNAPRTVLGEERAGELVVRVAAPPDKGKANEELVRFLSKRLGIPRSAVELVSGNTARHKVLRVPAEAAGRFAAGGLPHGEG